MGAEQSKPKGPDLACGVALGDVADGGMVGGQFRGGYCWGSLGQLR